MVTLRDVAHEAGVSVETVSRVLNGRNKEVWPSAIYRAEQIRRIAKRLGFRPNSAARTMRRGRFHQVACVVTRYTGYTGGHDFDGEYLEAATVELARRGYSAIFEPFLLDLMTQELVEAPRVFTELVVDGILGIAEVGTDLGDIDRQLARLGAPVVWVNRDPLPGVPCVISDEHANGYRLARHLIELGHRRIGYIGHSRGPYSVHGRLRGVADALTEAGLDTADLATKQDESPMSDAVRRYIVRHPHVSALICYNGLCYDAALHEAARLGRRVPDDLTLAYFGSVPKVAESLAMIILEIPRRQMAGRAVELLLDRIAGKPVPDAIEPIPGRLYVPNLDGRP